MIFSLSIFAIVGLIGLSIDIARQSRVKTSVQIALDAAVLSVATTKQANEAAGQTRLDEVMTADWRNVLDIPKPATTYREEGGDTIIATANVSVPTTFMKVLGFSSMGVNATSAARFGVGRAEVALVLDTTKSMDQGNRIEALKEAALKMIEDTYDRPGADNAVKFSVVPFNQYVNVGMDNRNATWMSVPNDGSYPVPGTYTPVIGKSGCTTHTGTWYDDKSPVSYQYETCESYDYGPPAPYPNEYREWHGCAGSRGTGVDTDVEANSAKPIPGLMNTWCSNPLQRLTKNKSKLRDVINDLSPSGQTYMASGLMWGWRTLSEKAPFEDGSAKTGSQRARKVLVLMTDGENVTSSSSPMHEGWNEPNGDIETKALCDLIKADGIEVYTVGFELDSSTTAPQVLAYCATTEVTHYHNATDAEKLAAAFAKIGHSLSAVRLSR